MKCVFPLGCVALLAAVAWPKTSSAEPHSHQDAPHESHLPSRFYQNLDLEAVREAVSLQARATSRTNMALRMSPNERLGELLFASSEIQRAKKLLPRDRDIHWASIEISDLLYATSEPAERPLRRERLRDELLAFRANHPSDNADLIAFHLAILAIQDGRYADAIPEYQRVLETTRDRGLQQMTLANLGEAFMLAGDLDASTQAFERALLHAEQHAITPRSRTLVLIGAAVAFDRLGDEARAIELASQARALAGGELTVLRDPSVFFEPEGEIAIYDYLSAMARARSAENESERRDAMHRALFALQTFLEIAETSPYRDHAKARLETLSRWLEAADNGRRGRARPLPQPSE